jgi:hypothetical protein
VQRFHREDLRKAVDLKDGKNFLTRLEVRGTEERCWRQTFVTAGCAGMTLSNASPPDFCFPWKTDRTCVSVVRGLGRDAACGLVCGLFFGWSLLQTSCNSLATGQRANQSPKTLPK